MAAQIEATAAQPAAGARRPCGRRPRGGGIRGREAAAGWLFTAPAVLMIVVFLVVPILMAAWVSVSDWSGIGNPFGGSAHYVGARNYSVLLSQGGLARQQLVQSITNNFYYVLLVVPLQTILALFLAVTLNRRRLAGRGFFRTAYYFPSVTSTVAISIVFLFLFSGSGVVNTILGDLGANGPTWFADPNGLIHLLLGVFGVHNPPAALAGHGLLGQSWWDWLSGPSIAMSVIIVLSIWTTSGTFMLIFLAALQNIPAEVEEAAIMDGTNAWQRMRRVTLPMLRPTLFLVLTLGLIGCWQVFDQVYIMSQGNPSGTTLTPAYLSYLTSFGNQQWGEGAAISFLLFAIIVVLTVLQRFLLREPDEGR
jgi:multiple sugar transport system permease protein